MVWLSCEGRTPHDNKYFEGFNYYPTQGFPKWYFPYRNQRGYLAPFVAIQIVNPLSK